MGIPRTAYVQEKLIPSKKELSRFRRIASGDSADIEHEAFLDALDILEAIRHDAREGWQEKYQ